MEKGADERGSGEPGRREPAGGPPFNERPASMVRKVIAKRMLESKLTIPHFYLFDAVDMKKATALRNALNGAVPAGGAKISFNDLVVKAAAVTLGRHPECNAAYVADAIRFFSEININIAVSTDMGLLVPTIRNCERKSLAEISEVTKGLVEKARLKKLRPGEMTGGTFTISNLGVFGLEGSFSIINPPQALILTVGAIQEVPVVENGALAVGTRMKVTLSCDHRAVDGDVGARFLADFRRVLESCDGVS
jgi:pyruvate dehydrogenase E2 component (dihydrolipoamide acetyltransferase)